MAMQKSKIYTVSQINSIIKAALEENLPSRITVSGEITDWKHHTSGHCYFTLKDENAVLPCVMWAGRFARVKFQPENGLEVFAAGHIDVYTPGGKYQLYVDRLTLAGLGDLHRAFEQMLRKLEKQGLFKDEYKKTLPTYPERIGILTSESGAAIHDITNSIYSRWPCVKLCLYPVPVQGDGAAEKIASVIRDINKRNNKLRLDVLILGRGGGSLEDLWAFNEEVLARAIFDSKIPIISAVGHEVNTTIADLVADARASTPTKAGVTAVPDSREVLARLENIETRLKGNINSKIKLAKQNLRTILASSAFRYPLLTIRNRQQQLDELQHRLTNSTKQLLLEVRTRLNEINEQVRKIEPHRLLAKKTVILNNLQNQANTAVNAVINRTRMQLTAQANRLAGLNPRAVLQRGYSITTNKKNNLLIKTPNDVEIEDLIITELAGENLIESKVTKK